MSQFKYWLDNHHQLKYNLNLNFCRKRVRNLFKKLYSNKHKGLFLWSLQNPSQFFSFFLLSHKVAYLAKYFLIHVTLKKILFTSSLFLWCPCLLYFRTNSGSIYIASATNLQTRSEMENSQLQKQSPVILKNTIWSGVLKRFFSNSR